MRFHSEVQLGGKTATGIPVPEEVDRSLGSSKRPDFCGEAYAEWCPIVMRYESQLLSCYGWDDRWDISPRLLPAEMHQTRPTVLWAAILHKKRVAVRVPFPELATTSDNGAYYPKDRRPPMAWPCPERGPKV